MRESDRKKIQEILGTMQCPKDFKCAESGFEDLCRAKDFGDEKYLHCLEDDDPSCPFAVQSSFGFGLRFCQCPLRVYLAKNLSK